MNRLWLIQLTILTFPLISPLVLKFLLIPEIHLHHHFSSATFNIEEIRTFSVLCRKNNIFFPNKYKVGLPQIIFKYCLLYSIKFQCVIFNENSASQFTTTGTRSRHEIHYIHVHLLKGKYCIHVLAYISNLLMRGCVVGIILVQLFVFASNEYAFADLL